MRIALALVVLVACAKKAAEPPRAEEAASAPAPEATKHTAVPTTGAAPPPPPPAPAGGGSAVDQARASGVLGPTDRAAFEVKGTIAIKSANQDVAKLAEARRDALQTCYDKALEFHDQLAGELVLRVETGKVSVKSSTMKHEELERCVIGALGDAGFAKATRATITLAFTRT